MKKALIASQVSDELIEFLKGLGYSISNYKNSETETYSRNEISGIITSNKLVLDQHSLETFPNLRWIGRMGSGMEIIDTDYCDAHQIRYFSSPDGIANSVAEHLCGMLLGLKHRIVYSFDEIRNGHWVREANRGKELEEETLGIIGYGHTGKAMAKKMSVFCRSILAYDKFKTGFSDNYARETDLLTLMQESDIISFHVPVQDDTRHYYNTEFFRAMKKKHILINGSRGAVVDTRVLIQAFEEEKLLGACLDVLEEETEIEQVLSQPGNTIEALLRWPVIITPHIAGYSDNAIRKMSRELQLQIAEIRH